MALRLEIGNSTGRRGEGGTAAPPGRARGLVLGASAQQQRPTAARPLGAGGGGAAGRGGHEAFGRSLHPIARAALRRAPPPRAPPVQRIWFSVGVPVWHVTSTERFRAGRSLPFDMTTHCS